jgi:hypothetical protein
MYLLQMFDEEIRNAGQQMLGGISATDTVVTIGVDVHVELFVGLYKGFAIFRSIAKVYIVIGSTMHQKKFTMKFVYTVHGR